MQPKYFYIICRDGQIIEVKYSENAFQMSFEAMLNKGALLLKEHGSGYNGSDISKVLSEEQYQNYVSSVAPKEYVRDGVWRDSKEKGVLRYEKWKKAEMEGSIKLPEAAETERSPEEVAALMKKFRPKFLGNTKV